MRAFQLSDSLVLIVVMGNLIWISWFLIFGIQKWVKGDRDFKWNQLFKNFSVKKSSGTLLIVESISGLVATGIFILLYLLKRSGLI